MPVIIQPWQALATLLQRRLLLNGRSCHLPHQLINTYSHRTSLYPSLRLHFSASHSRPLRALACCAGAPSNPHDAHAPHPPPLSLSSTLQRLQHHLNASSKGILATSAMIVLAWRQDDHLVWAFLGSFVNNTISRILKRVFNQRRPLTALHLKRDPGMPSSHAQTFGYAGLYAAIGVMICKGVTVPAIAFASSIFTSSLYMAWLRCSQGLHTISQVIVGVGFGYCMVGLWITLWHYMVKEVVLSSSVYHNVLLGTFVFSLLCNLGGEMQNKKLESEMAKQDPQQKVCTFEN